MRMCSPQKLPYVRADDPKRKLEALKLEAERSKELARLSGEAYQPGRGERAGRQAAGKQKAAGF